MISRVQNLRQRGNLNLSIIKEAEATVIIVTTDTTVAETLAHIVEDSATTLVATDIGSLH